MANTMESLNIDSRLAKLFSNIGSNFNYCNFYKTNAIELKFGGKDIEYRYEVLYSGFTFTLRCNLELSTESLIVLDLNYFDFINVFTWHKNSNFDFNLTNYEVIKFIYSIFECIPEIQVRVSPRTLCFLDKKADIEKSYITLDHLFTDLHFFGANELNNPMDLLSDFLKESKLLNLALTNFQDKEDQKYYKKKLKELNSDFLLSTEDLILGKTTKLFY